MSEPLVFLPGMMCDSRLFEPQIVEFSKERMVCVAPVTGFDSIKGIASEILEKTPPQFILAGLSLGGIIAMEMVRQAPSRITKLILMDTNYKAELPEVSAKREQQIIAVKEGRLKEVMRNEIKPNYLNEGSEKEFILNLCMAMADNLGEQAFIDQSKALSSRYDQTETLKKVKVPTLILCGLNDRLCPVKIHEEISFLVKNSTLHIIPNAGHLPTLENPKATNGILKEWLM